MSKIIWKNHRVLDYHAQVPLRTQVILMQELSWSLLKISRRNYLKLCQLHKIICEACPPYLNDLLPLERFDGQYELRNYSKLKLFRILKHIENHFCHPQRDYGIVSHVIYVIIHPIMLSKKP